jgi:excinuclease ABC subunit A
MKLAAHLQPGARSANRPGEDGDGPKRKRRMLYIFDEPTTGLHFDDVSKLLSAFRRLIDAGGSIVVIEHNLEVIKTADWVIDLGPEGGDRGGNARSDRGAEKLLHWTVSEAGLERERRTPW